MEVKNLHKTSPLDALGKSQIFKNAALQGSLILRTKKGGYIA
jgi:hypothetical protein